MAAAVRDWRAGLSGHGGVSVQHQWGHEAGEQQRELVEAAVIGAAAMFGTWCRWGIPATALRTAAMARYALRVRLGPAFAAERSRTNGRQGAGGGHAKARRAQILPMSHLTF